MVRKNTHLCFFVFLFFFTEGENTTERTGDAMAEIDKYCQWLERRNRKADTITAYRKILRCVLTWLRDNGREYLPERIGEDDIIALLNGYDVTETTIKHYIGILSTFLKRYDNPIIDEMGLLWNEQTHPNVKWMEPDEFERLLEAAEDPTDRMTMLLMAYAGLRRSEAAGLRISDIFSDRLTITGKGHGKGKTRIVPLSRKLAAEIDAYMARRQEILGGIEDPHLLVAPRQKGWVELTPLYIWRRIRALCERTGVDVSPHSFRRYFATQIYARMPDKDIHVLQQLLGHSSPVTTARYLQTDRKAMCQAVERL